MRRFILACAGLLACCCAAAGGVTKAIAAGQSSTVKQEKARLAAIAWLGGQIRGYQHSTWRWERVMGTHLTPTAGRVLTKMSVPDVKKAVVLWKGRAHAAHRHAVHPPHLRAFLCIHRYEGSWTDAGGPHTLHRVQLQRRPVRFSCRSRLFHASEARAETRGRAGAGQDESPQ